MLKCGSSWRPTELRRVIETFPSSTRVLQVMTDVGVGFLKGIGNPQGTQALACELVGTELAAWFGLDTVEFSLINVKDDDVLPLHNVGRTVQAGPAFICKLIDGDTWDGGDVYLSRLQSPSVVTKLIIFDTWIMNPDRYPPRGSLIPTPETETIFCSNIEVGVGSN